MKPSRLYEAWRHTGLDGVLLTSPVSRRYVSGFASSDGMVLLWKEGGAYLTDFRYVEAARREAKEYSVLQVGSGKSYAAAVSELCREHGIGRLGFEDEQVSFAQHGRLHKQLPPLEPMGDWLMDLRRVKSREEVSRIIAAQRIAEQALEETLNFICPGVTERQIAARLTYEMLRRGAENLSFDPIVASGVNGSMPHAVPMDKQLRLGEMITMDIGCMVDGYCSDMTRTVALGAIGEEQERVYQIVLEAQQAGIRQARAGITGAQLDGAGRALIERAGYGAAFGHSFGHGVGLEIHEAPVAGPSSEQRLQVGEIVTAEPGIYVEGRFGVRTEDMLLITQDGCENLTKAPKELRYL